MYAQFLGVYLVGMAKENWGTAKKEPFYAAQLWRFLLNKPTKCRSEEQAKTGGGGGAEHKAKPRRELRKRA